MEDRLASLAHELNNPLCYVSLNLGMVEEALEKLQQQLGKERLAALHEHIVAVQVGLTWVGSIVNDMKRLSREEPSGVVDIDRVIETTLALVATTLRDRARIVRVRGAVPLVAGSESRLGQVILNLLENAIDAASGQITVTTGTEARGRATITVEDAGRRIASEDLQRIFEPVGTGLGLWISHAIVSAMRGELTVESQPGMGTRFRVTLPARG